MRETQIMKRPRMGKNGLFRLAVMKDAHGGRTEVFANQMPPKTGKVVDSVRGAVTSWPWTYAEPHVLVENGCPDEAHQLVAAVLSA